MGIRGIVLTKDGFINDESMIPRLKVIRMNREVDEVLKFIQEHDGVIDEFNLREKYIDPEILEFLCFEKDVKQIGQYKFLLTTQGRFRLQNGGYLGEYLYQYLQLYLRVLLAVIWIAITVVIIVKKF